MIIALTAPVLDPNSRSRSVSRFIAAIAQAADRAPAPDLIVLPDCHTTALSGVARRLTAAMCTAFVETVARAAKEWGVWIAFGHPAMVAGQIVSAASVLDPDGDAFLRFPPPALTQGNGKSAAAHRWTVRNTSLGRWALCTWRTLERGCVLADDAAVGLSIIPAAGDASTPELDALCAAAKSAGCAVCFAVSQSDEPAAHPTTAPLGAIIDAAGKVVATLNGPQRVAVAELSVPAAPVAQQLEEFEPLE